MTWQIGILLSLLLALGALLKKPSYAGRWLFGAGTSCFMFLVGVVLTGHAWKEVEMDWSPSKQVYKGVLVESLVEKPKTYQCRVRTLGKEVLLYLPKDSLSVSLKPGDDCFSVLVLRKTMPDICITMELVVLRMFQLMLGRGQGARAWMIGRRAP